MRSHFVTRFLGGLLHLSLLLIIKETFSPNKGAAASREGDVTMLNEVCDHSASPNKRRSQTQALVISPPDQGEGKELQRRKPGFQTSDSIINSYCQQGSENHRRKHPFL